MARPTLATVALAAGVSLPTVSKVLNGREDVADHTRARVEQALRDHEYLPQATRRTVTPARVVDLVFDDIVGPYSTEVLHGVTDAGSELGIDIVVGRMPATMGGALKHEHAWARRLVEAGREGLIVVTSELTVTQVKAFDQAALPIVVIDPVNPPGIDVPSVGATNWAGGLAATGHLTSLGHRRIGFIGGPSTSLCSQARLHGYHAALENVGVGADPELVRYGSFNYSSGLKLAGEMLDLANPPSAIFAASDPTAVGVLAAARSRGLAVPDDLSLVGFDDSFLAEWSTPALTTVRQPLRDMGRVALKTLLRLVAGERLDADHVELATALVVRQSTAAHRPRNQ